MTHTTSGCELHQGRSPSWRAPLCLLAPLSTCTHRMLSPQLEDALAQMQLSGPQERDIRASLGNISATDQDVALRALRVAVARPEKGQRVTYDRLDPSAVTRLITDTICSVIDA